MVLMKEVCHWGLGIEASKTSHLGCVLFFQFVVPDVREH